MIPSLLLVIGIISGELVKIPQGREGGLTVLDIIIIILDIWALTRLKFRLKKPPKWLLASLFFLLFALISLLLTPLKLSQQEYLISFAYTARLALFLLFGWLVFSGAFQTIKNNITSILLTSAIILAILGFLQLIFVPSLAFLDKDGWDPHYLRIFSTFLDPNFLGLFFTLNLILLIEGFREKITKKLFYLPALLLGSAVILTFSRSAGLTLAFSLLLLSFLQKSAHVRSVALVFILIFLSTITLYSIKNPQIDRLKSAQFRLRSWGQGAVLFQSSPIFGVGFNSYRYALRQYHAAPLKYTFDSRSASATDSSLLFVAATTGIVGLGTFLIFLAMLFKNAFKSHLQGNKWGTSLLIGLAAILVNSLFINSLFYPFILIWVILMTVQVSLNS
ncbi:MAG: O-antigen ligase family protein [Patescibacteria group bacterium]|nr:O-antigen ligase family protein [Patescibacteria group bacterium]